MAFEYIKTEPTHADFLVLVAELNLSLQQITNDSGERSFSAEAFDPEQDGCLIVYDNKEAVACGVFRSSGNETCELKRMYSKKSGAGSFLIKQLEVYALSKGYRRAVLSTRRVNEKAVGFYRRHAYAEIEPYGKYVGAAKSICLGKRLNIFSHQTDES